MLLLVFFIYVFIITFVNTLNYSKIDVIEIEKVSGYECRNFKMGKDKSLTYILLSACSMLIIRKSFIHMQGLLHISSPIPEQIEVC